MTRPEGFDPSGRASGVLLHPTSLPGPGIGDIGARARVFVDWLAAAGQAYWQILPLVPVDAGGSPYNGLSALAGNPLLLSPQTLVEEGLLLEEEAESNLPSTGPVDYPAVLAWKNSLFETAWDRFGRTAPAHAREQLADFHDRNRAWLDDYSLFRALRDRFRERCWTDWPAPLRDREPAALAEARRDLAVEIGRHGFQQYLFDREWRRLREYANESGVLVIGDLPIFVAHDSADVWARREIFDLDERGSPRVVAGVPPDYFSETGQRWGNPLYRWDLLRELDFGWWVQRFRRTLEMVDLVRIDHFRGFESYWEIPAAAPTAVDGRWLEGPGSAFFAALERHLGPLPVIAEDLGLITQAVEELRDELGFPGMRVLQFAFDGDPTNPHLPGNYPPLSVGYTGTHDNDTVMGWWRSASDDERRQVVALLGDPEPGNWDFVELVARSDAALVVTPLQDLIGLGSRARMNTPGVADRNWTWRTDELPSTALAEHLLRITRGTGRG